MDDFIQTLADEAGWDTDSFGLDSNLICPEGTQIEQDCRTCPCCGATNPLAGLI